MSIHAVDITGITSPTRPRHQLNRSVSDFSPPAGSKQHGNPRHHHHFHRRERDDKSILPGSTNLQLITTHDGSRSEAVTPDRSRSGSRRASLLGSLDGASGLLALSRERSTIKDGDAKEEREKVVLRAKELGKSLVDLSTLSTETTRRLDDTYYSVLEKLGNLHSTIMSLKELAIMTRRLNDDFREESQSIITEAETQLDNFGDFGEQNLKIQHLEGRIRNGREKVQTLGKRVDAVRERVEGWQKFEGEWQEKTRKRIRVLWGIMGFVLIILVGLLVFQYTPSRSHGLGSVGGINMSRFNVSELNVSIFDFEDEPTNESTNDTKSSFHILEDLHPPQQELEEDPRLRAFDEL